MITSPERIQDMQIRNDLLECVEICLRNGLIEDAKELGEVAKKYGDKLKSHDYSK